VPRRWRHWVALLAIAAAAPPAARPDPPREAPPAPRSPASSEVLTTDDPSEPPRLAADSTQLAGAASEARADRLEPCPLALRRGPDPWRRFLVPAVESAGAVAVTVATNKWLGKARWANITLESIGRNLRSAWVLDDDQFVINQLGHPYQGVFPYTAARSAGFGFWSSAGFVLASSSVWEIVGETEPAAVNDQFTTVIGGVALGEMVHRIAGAVSARGGGWRIVAAALDPFAEVNRHVLGAPPGEYRADSRSTLGAGASVWTGGDEPVPSGARPLISLHHRAGMPGDASLRLERPFDHFDLEAAYNGGTSLTLRTRGLVAGRKFGRTPGLRGLWGAFVSFEYDDPVPELRTSTSAIGIGVSADASRDGFVVGGTVLASGVLLGTAGVVHTPRLEQRDYVMGPGAQGLVQLQVEARDRVFAGVELRQTGVFGLGQRQGDELVLQSRAGVLFRVAGPHGVSAEYTEYRRIAQDPFAGAIRLRGEVVSVYYTFASGRTWSR